MPVAFELLLGIPSRMQYDCVWRCLCREQLDSLCISSGLSVCLSLFLAVCLISVRACRFKCWQAGRRQSPVDGQWYPVNASSSSTVSANKKGRLSVHLKLPKNRLQWKLQEQLQQKLDAHPEPVDAAENNDPMNQSALAGTAQNKDSVLSRQLLQNNYSALE